MDKPRARRKDERLTKPANSEVKISYMPLEEIHAKYGPPKTINGQPAPRSFGHRGNWWG